MEARRGAKLRNNIRYAVATVIALALAWVLGQLLDTWLRGYEVGLTGGLVTVVVLWILLINGEDDAGIVGAFCRAIMKPFRQEPE